jgi:hypothetical protein
MSIRLHGGLPESVFSFSVDVAGQAFQQATAVWFRGPVQRLWFRFSESWSSHGCTRGGMVHIRNNVDGEMEITHRSSVLEARIKLVLALLFAFQLVRLRAGCMSWDRRHEQVKLCDQFFFRH